MIFFSILKAAKEYLANTGNSKFYLLNFQLPPLSPVFSPLLVKILPRMLGLYIFYKPTFHLLFLPSLLPSFPFSSSSFLFRFEVQPCMYPTKSVLELMVPLLQLLRAGMAGLYSQAQLQFGVSFSACPLSCFVPGLLLSVRLGECISKDCTNV